MTSDIRANVLFFGAALKMTPALVAVSKYQAAMRLAEDLNLAVKTP